MTMVAGADRPDRFSTGTSMRVARGTSAFAAAAVIQRGASLALLPLLTRVLTPSEYGSVAILATLGAVISMVVSVGLETAMLRAYSHAAQSQTSPARLLNTVGGFAIVFALGTAVLIAVVVQIAGPVLGVAALAIQIAAFGAAFTASATVAVMAPLRAHWRIRDYVGLSVLGVVVGSTLSLVFVIGFELGVVGYVLGTALGSLSLLVAGLVVLGHRWSFELEAPALRKALAFGLPLVPHGIAHWGLSVSDRLVLGALVPASAIAPYFAAFQACGPILVGAIALSQATQPLFAEAADAATARRQLGRLSTAQVLLVSLVAAIVAVVGQPLLAFVLPSEYEAARTYLPWMALGSALFGLYLIPMNAISLMAGKTGRVWMITVGAAATNIAMNLAFVPMYGPVASAVTTAVTYGLLLMGIALHMRWVCANPIPFETSRLAFIVGLISTVSVALLVITPEDGWFSVVIRMGVLGVLGLALAFSMFGSSARSFVGLLRPDGNRMAP